MAKIVVNILFKYILRNVILEKLDFKSSEYSGIA